MSKLVEHLMQTVNQIKDTFLKLPVTTCMIMAEALFVTLSQYEDENDAFLWMTYFLLFFAIGSLLVESIFREEQILKRGLGIGLAGIIAGVLVTIQTESIFGIIGIGRSVSLSYDRMWSVLWGYILTCVAITIYFSYRRSGLRFPEYILRVFTGVAQVTIIYWILCVGTLLLTGIIDVLFLNDEYFELESRALAFISIAYYATGLVYCLHRTGKEVYGFFRVIVRYVLLVMSLAAFAIIYVYMLKIVILWEIPSNQIFGILTALFCIAMPVSLMCTAYEKDTLLQKAAYILPVIFTPFILLQIYSVGVRIGEHGITPSRYMGVCMILFEILYIVWYLKWREKMGGLLLVIAGVIAVATLIPGVNMYSVSVMSQRTILRQYLQTGAEALSEEQLERIKGAYWYLNYESIERNEKKDYLANLLTMKQREELEESKIDGDESYSFYSYNDPRDIDISGYDHLYCIMIRYDDYETTDDIENDLPPVDLSALEVYQDNEEDIPLDVIDLREPVYGYLKEAMKHQGEEYYDESDMLKNSRIQVDPNTVLIPTRANIYYKDQSSEENQTAEPLIDGLYMEGYLLKKE